MAAGLKLNEASLEFARRRGLGHHEMWMRASRLYYLYELGRWDELLREADEVVRWDRHQGGTQIEVNTLMISAPVLAQRGRVDEAARHAAIFLPRAREIGDPQTLVPALVYAAFVAAMGGSFDQAVALAVEFERTTRRRSRYAVAAISTVLSVCVATGELALAEILLERGVGAPSDPATRHSIAMGRAILAEARGQREDAAALYRDAAAGWGEWGSVVQRAYALLGLGRCGDEDAGREGAAIFEGLGAVPFTALAA